MAELSVRTSGLGASQQECDGRRNEGGRDATRSGVMVGARMEKR